MQHDVVSLPDRGSDMPLLALAAIDQIPAMIAYWDQDEICRFANEAYLQWFGKSRAQLLGTRLADLLGPLYPLNLPYVQAVLEGEEQVFERQIPRPDGTGIRDSIATYIPAFEDGQVVGFHVHVADTTALKQRERQLAAVIKERDRALAEVRTLRGLVCVCSACKQIRDEADRWVPIESYLSARTEAQFTHGLCPPCLARLYPEP
jgi:PAS domain S-box-containing protein